MLHIAFNTYALVYAARLLERIVGWRWFAASFAISAIGGSLLSLALNPANLIGVGASGGIVGLSATTGVLAFRFPIGARRNRMLVGALNILVPSILPYLFVPGQQSVDVAAHVGGAIAGALVAVLLLRTWPQDEPRPRFERAATLVAAVFFAIGATSLIPIVRDYPAVKSAVAALAPGVPAELRAGESASDDLIVEYPRDPRGRYYHALKLADAGDLAGAQADLETAMHDEMMLRPEVTGMAPYIRGALAIVLGERQQMEAARMLVIGHCAELKPIFEAGLAKLSLCR